MTTPLIPVVPSVVGNQAVQTVNARDLHAFLEIPTEFSKWIDRRIEEYEFVDGQDFSSFLAKSTGGRPSKEYALTIDMAKELAMVERTEKGRIIRRYFIECEKRLAANRRPTVDLSLPALASHTVRANQVGHSKDSQSLDRRDMRAYALDQVLVTPQKAAPRSVIAAFLCPIGLLLWGMVLDRKAGRTTFCVLLTSPTSALVSAAPVSERSNRYV